MEWYLSGEKKFVKYQFSGGASLAASLNKLS
ncbi:MULTISPECIES: DUF5951 family protein [Klebsiella]|nr:DUF5951 family protein [Klebsiella aerogenes]MBZ4214355.1 DUF5951 family protein [Klebsiella aerogenes]